jgi:serine/threonine protein kinase
MEKFDYDLIDFAKLLVFDNRVQFFQYLYENLMIALSSLHGIGIKHCDVKNANILVNYNGAEITKFCLTDYSISGCTPRNVAYTVGFRAPYLSSLNSNNTKKRSVDIEIPSERSDIYASGMVFVSYINNICFYEDTVFSEEICRTRQLLRDKPDIMKLIDDMLNSDLTIPNYKPISRGINFRQNPIDEIVKQYIMQIGKEFECAEKEVNIAIDIASRFIEQKEKSENPESRNIQREQLWYASLMLAIMWDCADYNSILTDFNEKIELDDDFSKYMIEIITVLDGIIYNPVMVT